MPGKDKMRKNEQIGHKSNPIISKKKHVQQL